jgi:hypothetical protein
MSIFPDLTRGLFVIASISPWLAAGIGIAVAVLTVKGRLKLAKRILTAELVIVVLLVLFALTSVSSMSDHAIREDGFGAALWLAITLGVVVGSAALRLIVKAVFRIDSKEPPASYHEGRY